MINKEKEIMEKHQNKTTTSYEVHYYDDNLRTIIKYTEIGSMIRNMEQSVIIHIKSPEGIRLLKSIKDEITKTGDYYKPIEKDQTHNVVYKFVSPDLKTNVKYYSLEDVKNLFYNLEEIKEPTGKSI